jgi:hypothetical protein
MYSTSSSLADMFIHVEYLTMFDDWVYVRP